MPYPDLFCLSDSIHCPQLATGPSRLSKVFLHFAGLGISLEGTWSLLKQVSGCMEILTRTPCILLQVPEWKKEQ